MISAAAQRTLKGTLIRRRITKSTQIADYAR